MNPSKTINTINKLPAATVAGMFTLWLVEAANDVDVTLKTLGKVMSVCRVRKSDPRGDRYELVDELNHDWCWEVFKPLQCSTRGPRQVVAVDGL